MSMPPPPPPGQGPVDPRGAFAPPPPPMGGMPPPMPMPMMMPPPFYPPPPRGGGFVRGIFITLATSIFGLSIAFNIYLLVLTGVLSSEGGMQQSILVKGNPTEKIAVIGISGIIDSTTSQQFEKLIRQIEEDSNVKALVVELDTPGGGVTPSDEIYARLLKFREKKGIPVAASIASLGASGGYYVACAAEHIFAETTSITGSIGVYAENYNIYEMLQKWGVKDTTVVADGSIYKTAGAMTIPPKPEDEAYIKGMVNQMFDRFKQVVQSGRGTNITDMATVASGKIFTAKEAKDLGLIDTIDYPAAAYDWAATKAGLSRKHVVRYEMRTTFLDAFLGAQAKQPTGAGVTINGINLNVDRHALDHVLTPRMMYLWKGQ